MEECNDKVASLHQRLEEARLATTKGDVSPDHYRQVDEAINEALRELPITNSDDGPGPLSWRESIDPPKEKDLVPAELLEQVKELIKRHGGKVDDLIREPGDLVALLPRVGESQLKHLLVEANMEMKKNDSFRLPDGCKPAVIHSSSHHSVSSIVSGIMSDFEKENVDAHFELGEMIEKGEHWEMVKAVSKDDFYRTKRFAIKKFGRWHLRQGRTDAFLQEVDILKQLDHPNVERIYHVFPHEFRYYYVVLEYLEQELVEYIATMDNFDENMARSICCTIIDTIAYIHHRQVVHRDINLRSFALARPGDERSIRLTGFGEARTFSEGTITAPIRWYADRFVAPEILKKKPHGSSVDMWNIGCVVYLLLTGRDLMFKRGELKVVNKWSDVGNRMEDYLWDTSAVAKDFILKLLEKDPHNRMTAKEAARHQWMRMGVERLSSNNLTGNIRGIRLRAIKQRVKAALNLYNKQYHLARILLGSEFLDTYESQELIGKGSFSRVYKVSLRESGAKLEFGGERALPEEDFAAKQIQKRSKPEWSVIDEVCILKKLDHDNVIKIHEFYTDDPKYYYIVLDLVRGGDFFYTIGNKTGFNEQVLRDTCRFLFEAVQYIHSEGIVHRNISPESILLAYVDDITSIRVGGFGRACYLRSGSNFDYGGTPWYMAPEIIQYNLYGKPVDMWSLGVVLFNMLSGGQFPFGNRNHQNRKAGSKDRKGFHSRETGTQKREASLQTRVGPPGEPQFNMFDIRDDIMDDIKRDFLKFDLHCWAHVSEEAKDFIKKLLTVDPWKRLTASEAVEHPWLKMDGRELVFNDLTANLKNLRLFNAKRKLRKSLNMVCTGLEIVSQTTFYTGR